MQSDRVDAEIEGYRRISQLLSDARAVRTFFQQYSLPIPPSLNRLLGDMNDADGAPRVVVPPLSGPRRPDAAKPDWIWLPAPGASPQTLALAVLRREGGVAAPKKVSDAVAAINSSINARSVYNIGPRLIEAGILERVPQGWRLSDMASAPVIDDGFVWGPAKILNKSEIAYYRREVIVHLLRSSPDGLQTMQITRQLGENPEAKRAPISKDLVKMDMERLKSDGRVRKVNGRKWTALIHKGR
jgi:hypothetical protein